MNLNFDKKIILACTLIDTFVATMTFVYTIIKNSINILLLITFLVIFLSTILIQYIIYKKISNKLHVYDELLNSEYPLYGIVNYLSRKKKIDSKNKINNTYQLDELSLCVRLANNIEKNKHNDLLINWDFNGINEGEEDLSKINLRIGGDSSTDYSKLNLLASQCNLNQNSICEKYSAQLLCPSEHERCKYSNSQKIRCSIVKELSSATFNLLEFYLVKPIKPHHMLKMKVSYVWPQCFNPIYDYLLIDPQNFGVGVKILRINIICGEIIIKSTSQVVLYEVNYSIFKKNGKGLFEYNTKSKSFKYELQTVDSNCLYYAEIICN